MALPPRPNKNVAAGMGLIRDSFDCGSCRSVIALDDLGDPAL